MHRCDVCDALGMVLDGFSTQLHDGLRNKMLAQHGPHADIREITAKLDEQRAHILAAVVVWWVARSMTHFGDVEQLENALANAFVENGITVYEPSIATRDESCDHKYEDGVAHCVKCGKDRP